MRSLLITGLLLAACNSTEPAQVDYLEIVTSEADATCEALAIQHDVTFGEPIRPGDRISCVETLRSLSDVKATKLGTGRFWVIDAVCRNQEGTWVGTETMTGFGYRHPHG